MSDLDLLIEQVAKLERRLTNAERLEPAYRGIFVPVTQLNPKDSDGNTWSGAARNIGGYTFRPSDNSTRWPATASAVVINLFVSWASASASNYATLGRSNVINDAKVIALVAGVGYSITAIIPVDASGYFYGGIWGANSSSALMILIGYFK